MAKLRLVQPSSPRYQQRTEEPIAVSVVVDVPAIHLEGEYTYLAAIGSVSVGSLVKVPFSHGETFGFVTKLLDKHPSEKTLKWINKVLVSEPLFDEVALDRYRKIAEVYGASLISILKLGIPVRRPIKGEMEMVRAKSGRRPSSPDAEFVTSIFGSDWKRERRTHLLLPSGVLWDRVAISLYLADPKRTLIMVPTERDLSQLSVALAQRGISDFLQITSTQKVTERNQEFLRLRQAPAQLVLGTRVATFAPIAPEVIIIIDPGHEGYQERRSPYSRSDDPLIWDGKVITINHTRQLSELSQGAKYLMGRDGSKVSFASTVTEKVIEDLQRELRTRHRGAVVLLSINDSSFGSGLSCARCKNATRCDCGFPLRMATRGAAPSCSKCLKVFEAYRCVHCGSAELKATKSGGRSWALSLAKSIRGARVILSESTNVKLFVERKSEKVTIVIAEHSCEPRVITAEGRAEGYDIILAIGGRSGFNSSTLSKNDRFRMRLSRLRGLVNSKQATMILDLDPEHPEFWELRSPSSGKGLEMILQERRQLNLPPFSVLAELTGSDNSLHQLKKSLQADDLFRRESSEIFPVHNERLILKVDQSDRLELMRLLQAMVRLRSSKRLAPINFILSPAHL